MARYLGLDCSTQSLTALLVDTERGEVVLDETLPFRALPQFRCPQGFLENPDPRVRHADPLLWVAALDELFTHLRQRGVDLESVAGISGAAQQHGSVYLRTPLREVPPFQSTEPLSAQIAPLLGRPTAPLWLDSSTSVECEEIAQALGGHEQLVARTGSRAIERFTGPQIRKFWKDAPEAYRATREIHLVSSFMASLLVGTSAPIDLGDGAGMNLLDLGRGAFGSDLLEATAPDLAARLPPVVPSTTIVGEIAPYFVHRYGFAPGTPVVAFTGDNPSSLVGLGATRPGTVVISLGTSDTVFAALAEPRTDPRGFGHVFGNPAGGFLSLICFANGSLAREAVAQRVGLDWLDFERAILDETEPGNGGALLLPLFVPEMTPKARARGPLLFGDDDFVAWRHPARAARAVVEAQALAMRRYSDWIGPGPSALLVTGGAAVNRGIQQVLADVFQAEVRRIPVTNASALGAALRAARAVEATSFDALAATFATPLPAARPNPGTQRIYEELGAHFAEELDRILAEG